VGDICPSSTLWPTYRNEGQQTGDTGGWYEPVDGQPLYDGVVRREQQLLEIGERTCWIYLHTNTISCRYSSIHSKLSICGIFNAADC